MTKIADEDARLLTKAIEEGEAVLILGAGASATSTLANGDRVKQAWTLSKLLAEKAGLQFADDSLWDVITASIGPRLSEMQYHKILQVEYTGVQPSVELQSLFDYTWRRAYTWNIDDAVENIKGAVQPRRYYNGLSDKVSNKDGLDYLQFIHLHGDALKPEHGFIFSPTEYSRRLNSDRHDWYRQAAADYASYTPVFIGSRLNEPIMAAELDRARPSLGMGLGLAFLVTPDSFTEVQLASFKARNIVVVQATLAGFVEWLRSTSGKKVTPIDVARRVNAFANELSERFAVNAADVETAKSIIIHTWQETKSEADKLGDTALGKAAQNYLEGEPPTWRLSATDVPVWLTATNALFEKLKQAIDVTERVFVVFGQSGSGKTTATMQALLRIVRENPGKKLYELRGDVKSLRAALNLIERIHKDEHVIVYIGDAFIYGDSLLEDVMSVKRGAMTLVTGARSGEWREHIQRRIGEVSSSFQYQRFVEADFQPLVGRLLQYVPAPRFKRMTPPERIARLKSSTGQLLIALRETTESDRFTNVITREFQTLSDDACRTLALAVGISTIARTGLSPAAAREAYNGFGFGRPFVKALNALDGIVSIAPGGRLFARHETYVRHIIDNVASFGAVVDATSAILRTYTKYDTPIVKNVGRQDALLFKFLLNHNFNADLARRRNDMVAGLKIYEQFEVIFQLDGHYWLQYGQYLVEMGRLEQALGVLKKSIQAYPNNVYASHAYADVQLRVAAERPAYDAVTVELIGDAVKALEALHASSSWGASDQYPIVTLSERHVGALVRHGQDAQARDLAANYFNQLDDLAKRNSAPALQGARQRLAQYVTSGVWAVPQQLDRRTLTG
jgi:tetratricopeptide (TPR) repeat protein